MALLGSKHIPYAYNEADSQIYLVWVLSNPLAIWQVTVLVAPAGIVSDHLRPNQALVGVRGVSNFSATSSSVVRNSRDSQPGCQPSVHPGD